MPEVPSSTSAVIELVDATLPSAWRLALLVLQHSKDAETVVVESYVEFCRQNPDTIKSRGSLMVMVQARAKERRRVRLL